MIYHGKRTHLRLATNLIFVFQCEPGLGAAVMYDLLYNPPPKLMLLGGCSTVSTTIGEAAKMWNLVVVSSLYVDILLFTLSYLTEPKFAHGFYIY